MLHHWAIKESEDPIVLVIIILIKSYNKETIVGSGPVDIWTNIISQPVITLLNSSVVHAIDNVGNNKAHIWQQIVIGWKAAERLINRWGNAVALSSLPV
jgi:hypothetical protein